MVELHMLMAPLLTSSNYEISLSFFLSNHSSVKRTGKNHTDGKADINISQTREYLYLKKISIKVHKAYILSTINQELLST